MSVQNDIIPILQKQLLVHPLMEVKDICKLIYQSVYGGGHMISDPSYSLERILTEYDKVKEDFTEKECVFEPIGNGVSRLSLASLKEGLTANTLNQMFVLSANQKRGTKEELEEKLTAFFTGCKEGIFPFDSTEVCTFMDEWKKNSYPAISHSETYRQNYRPAYRVVDEVYETFYQVFLEIDGLLAREKENNKPLIVAIDGMAGSGKSTLGNLLKEVYDCNLFHMDDYFLQPHQRSAERFTQPGGNVDYERFKEEIYDNIERQEDFVYQKYDCSIQKLGEKVETSYSRLNIIEGAYSAHPYFKDRADLVFFMEISDEVQKDRIAKRNGEWMLQRFLNEWIPMEHKYFDAYGIREKGIRIAGENKAGMLFRNQLVQGIKE